MAYLYMELTYQLLLRLLLLVQLLPRMSLAMRCFVETQDAFHRGSAAAAYRSVETIVIRAAVNILLVKHAVPQHEHLRNLVIEF